MSLDKLFQDEPFSYIATKSGLIQISYNGKIITKLKGKAGSKFLAKVDSGDANNAQLVMAKETGHFKHGNEQISKNSNKK
jgi:hypothetical protein